MYICHPYLSFISVVCICHLYMSRASAIYGKEAEEEKDEERLDSSQNLTTPTWRVGNKIHERPNVGRSITNDGYELQKAYVSKTDVPRLLLRAGQICCCDKASVFTKTVCNLWREYQATFTLVHSFWQLRLCWLQRPQIPPIGHDCITVTRACAICTWLHTIICAFTLCVFPHWKSHVCKHSPILSWRASPPQPPPPDFVRHVLVSQQIWSHRP